MPVLSSSTSSSSSAASHHASAKLRSLNKQLVKNVKKMWKLRSKMINRPRRLSFNGVILSDNSSEDICKSNIADNTENNNENNTDCVSIKSCHTYHTARSCFSSLSTCYSDNFDCFDDSMDGTSAVTDASTVTPTCQPTCQPAYHPPHQPKINGTGFELPLTEQIFRKELEICIGPRIGDRHGNVSNRYDDFDVSDSDDDEEYTIIEGPFFSVPTVPAAPITNVAPVISAASAAPVAPAESYIPIHKIAPVALKAVADPKPGQYALFLASLRIPYSELTEEQKERRLYFLEHPDVKRKHREAEFRQSLIQMGHLELDRMRQLTRGIYD